MVSPALSVVLAQVEKAPPGICLIATLRTPSDGETQRE